MIFYRRHLPHLIPDDTAIFVTFRLAGSIPSPTNGPTGPVWLQDSRIASVIADALHYGESVRQIYHLHAWVIMPNHVHVIFEPRTAVSSIMQWLKGRTARLANRILARTGTTFWQDESFDHWVRSPDELQDLISYIENNPVKAGLADSPSQWPWSSAGLNGRRQKSIVYSTPPAVPASAPAAMHDARARNWRSTRQQ